MRHVLPWLALLGCVPEDVEPDDSPQPDRDRQVAIVATTAPDDYAVGVLATVSLDDHGVQDALATLHGDAVVTVEDDVVWQIDRLGGDAIRRYAAGSWTRPEAEWSVGEGTNPHDVATCAGRLFVSLYERDVLSVHDPLDGTPLGTVDLSEQADGDGLPEASQLLAWDGRLFAVLQRLDRDEGWSSAPGGRLVEVDCDALAVVAGWDVGPNPVAAPWDGGILVAAEDGLRAFDGTDVGEVLRAGVQERPVVDLALAADGRGAFVARREGEGEHVLGCLDATGEATVVRTVSSFVSDVVVTDEHEAWFAVRRGWEDVDDPGGFGLVDLDGCVDRTADAWIRGTLAPYDLAVY